eukprot:3811074-Amphidinium_carterae.1
MEWHLGLPNTVRGRYPTLLPVTLARVCLSKVQSVPLTVKLLQKSKLPVVGQVRKVCMSVAGPPSPDD